MSTFAKRKKRFLLYSLFMCICYRDIFRLYSNCKNWINFLSYKSTRKILFRQIVFS